MLLQELGVYGVKCIRLLSVTHLETVRKQLFLQLFDAERAVLVNASRCLFQDAHVFWLSDGSIVVRLCVTIVIV